MKHHAIKAMLLSFLAALALCTELALADGFVVRSAIAYERNGVYFVDADIDYTLNEVALEALASGVSLTFEVRLEVHRERRWRPDKNVAELLQLYELQYHALSERYIVRNLNSGEQKTYLTLSAALLELGDLRRLPMLDSALLNQRRNYAIRLKSELEIRSFPGPLRVISAFIGDWRLSSDWYEWRLSQ